MEINLYDSDMEEKYAELRKSGNLHLSSIKFHMFKPHVKSAIINAESATYRSGNTYERILVPEVEVFFDPQGFHSGKNGCFRARMTFDHSIHDAGSTKEDALNNFFKTAASLGQSENREDYEVTYL